MKKNLLIILLISLLFSFDSKKEFKVTILENKSKAKNLYIRDFATEKLLAEIPLKQGQKQYSFPCENTTVGIISTTKGDNGSFVILDPGDELKIKMDTSSVVSTGYLADSLLNYINKNNLKFINENLNLIIGKESFDIFGLFDKLRVSNEKLIKENQKKLSQHESEILAYQSQGLTYNFLRFYGRTSKGYSYDNPHFDFLNNLDNNTIWAKTLPHPILYKYEIQYLREHKNIKSASLFLNYIETQTTNKDLAQFLKAFYVREIISNPSYWSSHEQIFNAQELKMILTKEKTNKYYSFIQNTTDSYLATQKGEKAFDFTATTVDGKQIKLSDLKGKVVFIDIWATWCGPCITQRPNVIKLADKYKDNPNVAVLMISVDSSEGIWKKYLTKKQEQHFGNELFVENGMHTAFGKNYLINTIPRYILIDQKGIIINSNLAEPSLAVEQQIEQALKKN